VTTDTFARDNLPPRKLWPELIFTRPELHYPARLNCVSELLDKRVAAGHGDATCLISPAEMLSYAQLQARVNRICNVLVQRLGLVPGHRVLLRSANNPMMVACYLAVMKAGGIAVATMPLLRAGELAYPIEKARIHLALCDARLAADMEAARALAPTLRRIVYFHTDAADGLEAMTSGMSDAFTACDTALEEVCLIGFTSGTTGEPKGTMHFHRDVMAVCDAYSRNVLKPQSTDRFIGSPPLAFTFGLGGLVLFPLHAGASTILLERAGPDELLDAIPRYRATICFTAPTAYRAMLGKLASADISSLRLCVSAGEHLPRATFEAWLASTGIKLMDGIGSTELLHIFIAAQLEKIRPGATGTPVPGYEAKVIDEDGNEVTNGTIGRLAVRGPTGCRYLADDRQRNYVQNGWNVTGDTYMRDADGYFWYQARSDDMIISGGYNIAGPEVENALLLHGAVAECAVIGVPDADRGNIVKAFIVLKPGHNGDAAMTRTLQDFVKATVAPYKYPRAIEYRAELPKTQTGKLQRFRLREEATIPPP
jgi:2-aminobenzoate-CoA ligase